MKKSDASQGQSASELISKRIAELGDWRGETLGRMRTLIKEADPDVVEEWKWKGTPIWSHDGIICTGESYKSVVKLTFAKGASLKDPAGLFNSSLEGNVRRAIDIREGEEVDASAFKALVREAVALNKLGPVEALEESDVLKDSCSPLRAGGARNATHVVPLLHAHGAVSRWGVGLPQTPAAFCTTDAGDGWKHGDRRWSRASGRLPQGPIWSSPAIA